MPSTIIRDPSIAAGFGALANAFFPDPTKEVRASLMGAQREAQLAHAQLYGAQAGQVAQQTTGNATLAQLLADPTLAGTVEGRAKIAAAASMAKDGLQHGPKAVAGFSTFTNPNFASPADLSTIMSGTGVQHYDNTPEGFARTDATRRYGYDRQADARVIAAEERANASRDTAATRAGATVQSAEINAGARRDVAGINSESAERRQDTRNAARITTNAADNETRLQLGTATNASREKIAAGKGSAGAAGGKPGTVGAREVENLEAALLDGVKRITGASNVDPETMAAMRLRAAELRSQTKNAERAVQDTLAEFDLKPESSGFFGLSKTVKGTRKTPAVAAPAAAAAQAPGTPQIAEGRTATNKATGEQVIFRNGRWEPLERRQ